MYQRYIDDILPIESTAKEGIDPERRFFVKSLRAVVDDAVGGMVWRYGITDKNELAYVKEDDTHAEVVYINLDQCTIRFENHHDGVERERIEKGTFEEFEQGHKSIERVDVKAILDGIKEVEQFLEGVHAYQEGKGE